MVKEYLTIGAHAKILIDSFESVGHLDTASDISSSCQFSGDYMRIPAILKGIYGYLTTQPTTASSSEQSGRENQHEACVAFSSTAAWEKKSN